MQEVIRVINLQLTGIFKAEEYEGGKEQAAEKLAKSIKELLCIDDVQVLDSKDFVMDV